MWGIENPFQVYQYIFTRDMHKKLNFMAIINQQKYNQFQNRQQLEQLALENNNLSIFDVKIKNPDNPAQLKDAKLITFLL